MGADIMKSSYGVRQQLIGMVQEEFNRVYPFLKLEFRSGGQEPLPANESLPWIRGGDVQTDEQVRDAARNILDKDIHLSDNMKVSELETSLRHLFGAPVQMHRKSGNFWMETRMTRDWTLKQQNEHGRDIASGIY